MSGQLEEMSRFFDARVDGYEEHMREHGAGQYYLETARLIPAAENLRLLDLGCGTGLELDEIWKINPSVSVTGVDLSAGMLERLKAKHSGKAGRMTLINASYFDVDFGVNAFDAAVSVQTMHHFTHEQKIALYQKLYQCLVPGGCYIETDYTAPTQRDEDFYYSENRRLREELGVTDGFYHYDTPCTAANQLSMLRAAGFESVELHRQYKNTSIIAAKKTEGAE